MLKILYEIPLFEKALEDDKPVKKLAFMIADSWGYEKRQEANPIHKKDAPIAWDIFLENINV